MDKVAHAQQQMRQQTAVLRFLQQHLGEWFTASKLRRHGQWAGKGHIPKAHLENVRGVLSRPNAETQLTEYSWDPTVPGNNGIIVAGE